MPDIAANIRLLKAEIPPSVMLVAVSKSKPVGDILEAYTAGQRIFGENRVQELLQKKDLLPGDIEWHLVGHLQTNKVKPVVPFVSMIHSVDSFKLLKVIDSEATEIDRKIDCLLQLRIAVEETKYGFTIDGIRQMLESDEYRTLKSVRIRGVMGIATFTDDVKQIRSEFRNLATCFEELRKNYFQGKLYFKEISMGMSGDYKYAVAEGSTIVRIGSLIFGERKGPNKNN
jgi:pyridoxal phosphate enzyme (YggS family)